MFIFRQNQNMNQEKSPREKKIERFRESILEMEKEEDQKQYHIVMNQLIANCYYNEYIMEILPTSDPFGLLQEPNQRKIYILHLTFLKRGERPCCKIEVNIEDTSATHFRMKIKKITQTLLEKMNASKTSVFQ